MLSHKSLVACATLILCSFSATNVAVAGDAGADTVVSCGTDGGARIRHVGIRPSRWRSRAARTSRSSARPRRARR
jgi:hypothetical protein